MVNTYTGVLYSDYGLSIDILSRMFLLLLVHMQGFATEIEMLQVLLHLMRSEKRSHIQSLKDRLIYIDIINWLMFLLSGTIALLSTVLIITSTTAFATSTPQQQEQPTTAAAANSTTYTDDTGFTVDLPPGWTAIDQDNTSQEAKETAASQHRETLVEFCPERQSAVMNISTQMVRCDDDFGIIQVSRYVNMDTNPDFARGASSIDPLTGLIVMNLTAEDLVDFHDRGSPEMIIVQSKDVLVNVSSIDNAGAQWKTTGKLILAANQINELGWIQLLFVDWTSGYEVSYVAPKGRGGAGESISIFGIGLDNLPSELEPIMQIMTSANLQRPPSG